MAQPLGSKSWAPHGDSVPTPQKATLKSTPPQRVNTTRPSPQHRTQLPSSAANIGQVTRVAHQRTSHVYRPADREYQKPPAQSLGPILKPRQPWQTWSELTVRVANLPPFVTTWDLWKRFECEGNVIFIELHENRRGVKDGTARIRFNPPPRRDFWATNNIIMPTPDGEGDFQVKVAAEPQKRRFEIQSPVRKNIWYPEMLTLYPESLGFGVMLDETTMMNMQDAQSSSRNDLKLNVDLLRNRIIVTFQLAPKDPQVDIHTAAETNSRAGLLDRVNKYMFVIPFGQLQKIYRVEVNETQWALVLSLESPPQFFRKRMDPKASHSAEALSWSEFDTWYRQTDIVYDPRRLATAALALRRELPVIDIGRWTTYRFLFTKNRDDPGPFDQIKNALQDYNIEVVLHEDFSTVPRSPTTLWPLIDPPTSDQLGSEINLLKAPLGEYGLPFEVRYQLEVCISQGVMNEHNISLRFVKALADLASKDQIKARHILEYAAELGDRIYDPTTIFNNAEAQAYSPKAKIPHYCAYSRKATITPTTIYYSSPAVETTNRVIRKYTEAHGDRFLRVQFTDEKFEGRINSCADKDRNDEIFIRVYRTLLNGIQIGHRHYEFLAFGNSQFRENGAYFFCPTEHLTCADIRQWMGDFSDITIPAKYAARLGLCFSTTREIQSSGVRIVPINDVERSGHCFTDGVGKISYFLSSMIATELNLPSSNPSPSAFQFRMGGCKGILASWPDARGQEVHIRKSQSKFRAIYNGLEIIRCSRYSPATLNRQTITILSSLGVPDEVFNRMLLEQLLNYQSAMVNKTVALDLLSRYIDDNHMTMVIAGMILDGFMEVREPFVSSLLHLWRAWSIKLLKEKAKIIVENGAFLLGVTDETGTLRGHNKITTGPGRPLNVDELPQIFVQVPEKKSQDRYVVIEGICLLGRNPSLHPGDIRVVQAVNVPALHHLRDVIVFSQLGERDVPSMCSGGDLDGDDFFCIWDKDLTPGEWNAEPMNYTAVKPRELDRPVEIQDVMRFFVRHMKNDTLPQIAHAHMALADFLENGIKDPRCLELAELHSKAVDYVKTGEPAEMPKRLKPRMWPHFMEKKHKPKEQVYISRKILGQLYDKVESVDFVPQYEARFDRRILQAYSPDNAILKTARQLKTKYDTAVRRIMAQQGIETEFEIWSTFVLSKPRVGSDYKIQEDMAIVSSALKDRFRKVCIEKAGGKDFDSLGPFVAAMYRVTWEEMEIALHECRTMKILGGNAVPSRKMEPKYMPLISFPWLFHDVLGRIATGIEQREDLEKLGLPLLPTVNELKRSRRTTGDIDEYDSVDFVKTAEGVTHRGEILDLFRPDDVDSEGDEIQQPYAPPGSIAQIPSCDGSGFEYDIADRELNEDPDAPWNVGISRSAANESLLVRAPSPARSWVEDDISSVLSSLDGVAMGELDGSLGENAAILKSATEESLPPAAVSPAGSLVNIDVSVAFSSLINTRNLSSSFEDLALLDFSGSSLLSHQIPDNFGLEKDDERLIGGQDTPRTCASSFSGIEEMVVVADNSGEDYQGVEIQEVILGAEMESPLEKLARLTGH